jgi:demethylmenaquinone methyltransferase/2-methoxy-6-polyprenyl-1,4-benzoquinol methylase
VCEFSRLRPAPLDAVYAQYLTRVLPAMARRLSPSADAYDYLAESIRDWPAQPELAARIGAAGWTGVRWVNLSFGVVALHLARRPQ